MNAITSAAVCSVTLDFPCAALQAPWSRQFLRTTRGVLGVGGGMVASWTGRYHRISANAGGTGDLHARVLGQALCHTRLHT
jgi:hypothetical protein